MASSLPTESILTATADAARVLSGAQGTAIASRFKGVIVCRARSGEMAPALGSPLNVNSGISGECLRTAATLICHDAAFDERVDTDVCRNLGIRSIVVVPLRGRNGILGILEAFSSEPGVFQKPQVNSLRALAEIAEMAFEREALPVTTGRVETPAKSIAKPAGTQPKKVAIAPATVKAKSAVRYWIATGVSIILFLSVLVIRMTWRQTGAEIAASEPPAQAAKIPETTAASLGPASLTPATTGLHAETYKPDAGINDRQYDRSPHKETPENAADVERSASKRQTSHTKTNTPAREVLTPAPAQQKTDDGNEPPPSIEIASSNMPSELVKLAAGTGDLPQFGSPVSQGVTEPVLLDKVNPTYPVQARQQRLAGPVVLDAAIGIDGKIHKVKIVSGIPSLASAAAEAVRQWRYSPGLLNGKPIEIQKRITVMFKLP
jgi:TonB family protein